MKINLITEFINKIIPDDCLKGIKQLPDNSIDCCISSPPYWQLRDYGIEGQIGMEENYLEYISKLIEIYGEVKRVLKPTGTCFVNLGDKYLNKSLLMIPERFAIGMTQQGWTLRNTIIWHKPNQIPSNVTDRFTVDFEKIFFFVKQPRSYYFKQQLDPYIIPLNRSNEVQNEHKRKFDTTQKALSNSMKKNKKTKTKSRW